MMSLTPFELTGVLLSIGCLWYLINGIGKRIIIPEAIAAFASINYLVMPVVAYHVFNRKNDLAVLWETYMPINSDTYFSVVLPAFLGLTLGLFWPLKSGISGDIQLLQNVRSYLASKSNAGFVLIILGLIFSSLYQKVGPTLSAAFYLGGLLLFVGLFYLLYCRIRYKWLVLAVAFGVLILQSIRTAMYGEFIFWSFFMTVYLLTGVKRITIVSKTALMVTGIFVVLLIQSVKHEYRHAGSKANAGFFFTLISDRLTDPLELFKEKRLFSAVTRGNQGFLMARTIDYVPKYEPFANGETIITSIAASIVPRFLWTDKPALGGAENTCRFLGDCGKRDYSYNIGQIGEGYVNFGRWGNMVYMFLYGLFINWSLYVYKKISIRVPTLLLWIPLIFFASLSMETDLLTILNTFIKGSMFALLIYGIFRMALNWRI